MINFICKLFRCQKNYKLVNITQYPPLSKITFFLSQINFIKQLIFISGELFRTQKLESPPLKLWKQLQNMSINEINKHV